MGPSREERYAADYVRYSRSLGKIEIHMRMAQFLGV